MFLIAINGTPCITELQKYKKEKLSQHFEQKFDYEPVLVKELSFTKQCVNISSLFARSVLILTTLYSKGKLRIAVTWGTQFNFVKKSSKSLRFSRKQGVKKINGSEVHSALLIKLKCKKVIGEYYHEHTVSRPGSGSKTDFSRSKKRFF
jgi:hypothetical protein